MGRWVMGLQAGEIWWSTSDIGWIVGHSYIVYAPLMAGCTTIAYEGALDHPGTDAAWSLIEEFGVRGAFTSPTAVRLLMRNGLEPARAHDLSSLERVVCAGEVLNAPAWRWLQHDVLGDRVPVIDHMWQTETGGPIFGNPVRAGHACRSNRDRPVSHCRASRRGRGPDGVELGPGEKGVLVMRRPFPGLIASLWGEPER